VDITRAVIQNKLKELRLDYEGGYCTGVVLASGGYPGKYQTGFEITGSLQDEEDVFVFHAGSREESGGRIVTDGGRVICVSALGRTLGESIDKAYQRADRISFENMHYRRDIGQKGIRFIEGR
jgi:phosphoribosylamine--glycine ligase